MSDKDLRADIQTQPSFSMAWCHGAPGIALSRLKAWQASGEHTFLVQARIALNATMSALYYDINGSWKSTVNFSLCHGIGGNADILLKGGQLLNENEYINAAHHAGQYGIQRYGPTGITWPGGLKDPKDNSSLDLPGLYLGQAGVGYFYLRLAHPDIDSIL